MLTPDGTAMHNHLLYSFQVSNATTQQNGTVMVLQGTATVTMPNGPVQGVPITLKVFNQKLIAMWIGPDKVNSHFGTNPIYGTVSKPTRGIMSEMKMMKG